MGRIATALAGLALGASAASCSLIDSVNRRAYEEYHASRWQAVAQACASFSELVEPRQPATPRVCEPEIASGYQQVVVTFSILDRDWHRLVNDTGEALPFIAEMLSVLDKRDTLRIESLAPQIEEYTARQDELELAWRDSKQALQAEIAALQEHWQAVWPENGLSFDLGGAIAEELTDRVPLAGSPRFEALRHFHENEYTRLAQEYLGFKPEGDPPNAQSHIPAGCDELAYALRSLEGGLLLRYSLDAAAQANAQTIVELTGADLSKTPWEDIQVPPGRYGDRRVPAAVARLKLLRYLDEVLNGALNVLVREVQLQWEEVWPGNPLETNIFAFAGLERAN